MSEIEALKAEIEALKAQLKNEQPKKKFSEETPLGFLQGLADKTYTSEKETCAWTNSPLENLDRLKSDLSGKVGELFAEMLCKKSGIASVYTGDVNSTDGTYDIVIKDKKVEIKTAKLGKQKGFQHESLRLTGYDYLMFVDVTPSYLYMTILPKFDLRQRSEVLERTAHLRKGTTDVFKLDLNEKILHSLIAKGCTLKIVENTPLSVVTEFLLQKIV